MLTFIDLFSGIGGFRLGMEMAGHKCLGHCEIDKFANKSYIAIHKPKEGEWYESDITRVRASDIPRADVWCFGFPCQDISVAGKQKGFSGNRSSLFFTVTRLIRDIKEEDRPKYLFIENVKNLLSINRGYDFLKVLIELDRIGYDAEWQLFNSKDYGIPQNRERVFIIGYLRGRSRRKIFPITRKNRATLKQIIADKQAYRVFDPRGISCTLISNGGGAGAKTGLYLMGNKPNRRIRRLTPRECFRLQGFPDEYFDRAREVNSDNQLYKQAGNSVTVNVIYEIARRLEGDFDELYSS
ncbi:DNA cytosine methyltransferase [Metaclostridioides mangenotii]|uniref:DNA cytosine methyltransferase n=1 Tax=Metaclostridioides mangenotii TaxID=1540 RepID=UPI0026ED8CB1|nr:DNA cytosine methyltransferase [Clostridioides mangenotii]